MKQCGIMRVEKRRRSAVYGLQIEANRTPADHQAGRDFERSDIQWDKTSQNVHLVKTENWNKAISAAIKASGAKERKDSVVLLDGLYTAPKAWFEGKTREDALDYFKACLRFHEAHYGRVINAVIHFDETTPHMQVASIPLVQRGEQAVLSAKQLMGNRDDYRKRQDAFYDQVSKQFGLDRGEVNKRSRKHIDKRVWQLKELNEKTKQLQMIHDSLVEKNFPMVLDAYLDRFLDTQKVAVKNGSITLKDWFSIWCEQQFEEQLKKYPGSDALIDECRRYLQECYSPIDSEHEDEYEL